MLLFVTNSLTTFQKNQLETAISESYLNEIAICVDAPVFGHLHVFFNFLEAKKFNKNVIYENGFCESACCFFYDVESLGVTSSIELLMEDFFKQCAHGINRVFMQTGSIVLKMGSEHTIIFSAEKVKYFTQNQWQSITCDSLIVEPNFFYAPQIHAFFKDYQIKLSNLPTPIYHYFPLETAFYYLIVFIIKNYRSWQEGFAFRVESLFIHSLMKNN